MASEVDDVEELASAAPGKHLHYSIYTPYTTVAGINKRNSHHLVQTRAAYARGHDLQCRFHDQLNDRTSMRNLESEARPD